jgi:hypothetical protein
LSPPPSSAGGSRQRLARQPLVAVRRVVDEGRDDHGVLAHILFLDPFVRVHVRVVRARVVLDVVLDELEARQADSIEGLMIL